MEPKTFDGTGLFPNEHKIRRLAVPSRAHAGPAVFSSTADVRASPGHGRPRLRPLRKFVAWMTRRARPGNKKRSSAVLQADKAKQRSSGPREASHSNIACGLQHLTTVLRRKCHERKYGW